jgi:hypothetical protein
MLPSPSEVSADAVRDSERHACDPFIALHPPFPAALDTPSLLADMQRRMEEAGVESFAETVAAASEELAKMPEARARALGPGFWTKRLVSLANRALRASGKQERWTEVRLYEPWESSGPAWMLFTPPEAKALEQLGIGRRVRPHLRFVSLPFTLVALGLGVLAFRTQTTGSIVLALVGYVTWFVASQVATHLSGRRSSRSL